MNIDDIPTSDLVKAAHEIAVQMDELKCEYDELASEIKRRLADRDDPFEPYQVGNTIAKLGRNHRFNKDMAARVLTPAQLRSISALVPQSSLAQEKFPHLFSKMVRTFEPKLTLSVPKDVYPGEGVQDIFA